LNFSEIHDKLSQITRVFLLNQLLEMKKTMILDMMQSKMIVRTTWPQSKWLMHCA